MAEEALYRPAGGNAAMRRQLQHLLRASRRPGVTVRVIPCTAGQIPAWPFAAAADTAVLAGFPDGEWTLHDTPGQVRKHADLFKRAADAALTPADTADWIAARLAAL